MYKIHRPNITTFVSIRCNENIYTYGYSTHI